MAGNENSGRKGFGQEIAHLKEKIKAEAIVELAESKLHGHLKTIDELTDRQGVKEIVMPVYLKSQVDRKDIQSGGKPLILDSTLTKKHGIDNSTTGDSGEQEEI